VRGGVDNETRTKTLQVLTPDAQGDCSTPGGAPWAQPDRRGRLADKKGLIYKDEAMRTRRLLSRVGELTSAERETRSVSEKKGGDPPLIGEALTRETAETQLIKNYTHEGSVWGPNSEMGRTGNTSIAA